MYLCSEKFDVEDHYRAWRHAAGLGSEPGESTFSFCHYPFLLDTRAKSALLQLEVSRQQRKVRENPSIRQTALVRLVPVQKHVLLITRCIAAF